MKKILKRLLSFTCAMAIALPLLSSSLVMISQAVYNPEVNSGVTEDYYYCLLEDGTAMLTSYINTDRTVTDIVVPSMVDGYIVTSLRDCLFTFKDHIESITLPNTLTTIGYTAFAGCTSLTSIAIPDSVTVIGGYAFQNCTSLSFVKLSNNMTELKMNTFQHCLSLKSIELPNSITNIESDAFYNCTSLETVKLPSKLRSIGNQCFLHCQALKTVDFQDTLLSKICGTAFEDCRSLEEAIFPNTLTDIEGMAFLNCSSLKKVVIPENLSKIGGSVFAECSSLTDLTLKEGLRFLGNNMFSGCTSLDNVFIPKTITNIEDNVFNNCISLKHVTLEDGFQSLGYGMFYKCINLSNITIPESVEYIGNRTFEYCNSLKNIDLPESVEYIGFNAFSECNSLETINIPNNLKKIENRIFYNCTSLDDITIPENVESIGVEAFYNCSSLSSINIPNNVTSIGEEAFAGCASLAEVEVPSSVTEMGDGVFEGCTSLKNIKLDAGLKSIGSNMFNTCTSLKSITIPGSVETIGVGAFSECTSLSNVNLQNGITAINDYAFANCTAMKSIIIPDSVTYISPTAFFGIDDITLYGNGEVIKNYYSDIEALKVLANPIEDTDKISSDNGYTLIVKDKNDNAVKNAEVNLGNASGVTDVNGKVIFDGINETGISSELLIYVNGTLKYKDSAYVINSRRTDILELSDLVVKLSVNGGEYKDALKESTDVNIIEDSISIKCSYLKENNCTFKIKQNDKVIAESQTGEFLIKADKFEKEKPAYICIFNSSQVCCEKQNLNISFAEISIKPLKIGANQSMEFKNIPLIDKLNLPFKDISIPVDFKFSDNGDVRIGLNLNVEKIGTEYGKGNLDNGWNYVKGHFGENIDITKCLIDNPKDGAKRFISDASGKFDLKLNLYGYLEGNVFLKDKIAGKIIIRAEAKTEFGTQIFVASIPIVLEIAGSGQVNIVNDISYSFTEGFDYDLALELIASLEAYAGAGIKGVASMGIYGEIKLKSVFNFLCWNNDTGLQKVTLSGNSGLKAKVLGMSWKYTIFNSDELYLYKKQEASPNVMAALRFGAINSIEDFMNEFDSNQDFEAMDRSYLSNRSEWSAGSGNASYLRSMVNTSQNSENDIKILQSNAYTDISPKLITCGDTTMMVYVDDDQLRSDNDRTNLVFSIYENGGWSEPVSICNDGTADFNPDIATDGENIWVVWQNAKTQLSDAAVFSDISNSLEISVAKYDFESGIFVDVQTITSNGICESNPKITIVDGMPVVCWWTNDSNSYFGTSGDNTIHCAQLTENEWVTSEILTTPCTITALDTGSLSAFAAISYTLDGDNDFSTTEDQRSYVYTLNNMQEISLSDSQAQNVQFNTIYGSETLTWYADGNIKYLTDNHSSELLEDSSIAAYDYLIIGNAYGDNSILYTYTKDGKSELYIRKYDTENNVWGQAVVITNQESYIQRIGAAYTEDGIVAVFNKTDVDTNYDEINALCSMMAPEGSDLLLDYIDYFEPRLIPGQEFLIEAYVTNCGIDTISEVNVEITDENGNIILNELKECFVKAGASENISVSFIAPQEIQKTSYTIKITPVNESEKTLSDNEKQFTLGLCDFNVSLKKYTIGTNQYIWANVQNSGYETASGILQVYDYNSGNVLYQYDINNMSHGENEVYQIKIDERYFDSNDSVTVGVRISTDFEQIMTTNDDDYVYVTKIEQEPEVIEEKKYILEAENAILSDYYIVGNDASSSNGSYISAYQNTGFTFTLPSDFEAGNYTITVTAKHPYGYKKNYLNLNNECIGIIIGSDSSWQDYSFENINISSGDVISLQMYWGWFDVDCIKLTRTVPETISSCKIEAENISLSNSFDVYEWEGASDNRYVRAYQDTKIEFVLAHNFKEGEYDIKVVAKHPYGYKKNYLCLNGQSIGAIEGQTDTWTEYIFEGQYLSPSDKISFGMYWGWFDIDYIEITPKS